MQTRYCHLNFPPSSSWGRCSHVLALHGDEPVLDAVVAMLGQAAVEQGGSCLPCGVEAPDLVLLALDAGAKHDAQETLLQTFAERLKSLVSQRGQECQVSGLPTLLVLVHAERLARPADSAEAWIARVQTTLMERSHHLTSRMHHRIVQDRRLFGTVHLTSLAVTTGGPPQGATVQPFSSRVLLEHIYTDATRHAERQLRQGSRLTRYGLTMAGGLGLLLVLAGLLASDFLSLSAGLSPHAQTVPDPALQLLQQLRRLVAFDGYQRDGGVLWVPWFRDARQALSLSEQIVALSPADQQRIARLAAQARSLSERMLFLGLVRMDTPGIPVLRPLPGPQASLEEINKTARELQVFLSQRNLFATEDWPDSTPAMVAAEFRAASGRAYEEWLERVRRLLPQAVAQQQAPPRLAWLQVVRKWLPQEAVPHLTEWLAGARFLQQQAGLPTTDPFAELTAFVERQQATLDLTKIRMVLPSQAVAADNTSHELRPLELRLDRREGGPVQTWRYRVEQLTPLLGRKEAWVEFSRMDAPDQPTGPMTVGVSELLTATVEAADEKGQRFLLIWSPVERGNPWLGLYVFHAPPRLIPAQQTDARPGVFLPQARWVDPDMGPWKLPELMPRGILQWSHNAPIKNQSGTAVPDWPWPFR